MGRHANETHTRQVGKKDHTHPCDGCDKLNICRSKELACRAFKAYFNSSSAWRDETRAPTSRIFNDIFNPPDDGAVINLADGRPALRGFAVQKGCARNP